jgi:hypothetical protein
MKKTAIAFLTFFSIICYNISIAQSSGNGVGIILGEPTGITFKHWLNNDNAVDAAIAWSFIDKGTIQLHADYLYRFDVFGDPKTPAYIGLGGRIKLKNDNDDTDSKIGARAPIGAELHFPESSLSLFAEVVPILDITPDVRLSFNLAVGIRYFFK